jgi:cytochrome c oxidase accessory protein FixG
MQEQHKEAPQGTRKKPYFKDMLQTVDDRGRRNWLFPKRPKGRLYNLRALTAVILLLFFFAAPFITYKGEQFILLDVMQRKFILFGQVFWPQDFHLLVLSIIAFIVFIILFTVVFGRLFCGWACPQTVFMEFVFRQIEYLIEGDYNNQKKLAAREWDFEKTWKKSLKHLVFFMLSLIIVSTITAYIISAEKLGRIIYEGPSAHFGLFTTIIIFSAVFYLIYAFFREQVCILVCPYGRLQGVLLDEKSTVVAYDHQRGEPRGPFRKGEDRNEAGKGDCIDCNSCVAVCPTGIDIRNGTQLECINCAACIDACNEVMDRVKLPRGLVRYDSEKGIVTGRNKFFNARSVAYTAVLVALLVVISSMFAYRGEVEATILRLPGSQYQRYGEEHYANIYKIQLVNKTGNDMPVDLKLIGLEGEIVFIGNKLAAIKGEVTEATFMVVIHNDQISAGNMPLKIGVFSDDRQIDVFKANFLAPASFDNNLETTKKSDQ